MTEILITIAAMGLCLLAEVGQIDVAIVVRFHRHDLVADHLRRGRIGAVG